MSRLSRRLRRSAIISLKALLILLVMLVLIYWVGTHVAAQGSSTRSGPLPKDDDTNPVFANAHDLMSPLPSLSKLSADSLRFAAMPSFGRRWFAVALSRSGKDVRGIAVILDRETGAKTVTRLTISAPDFAKMVSQFDNQIDGYRGEARWWADGTSLAFERKRGKRVRSGVGNSPCHYSVITNSLAHNLSVYLPDLRDLIQPGVESYAQSEHCGTF